MCVVIDYGMGIGFKADYRRVHRVNSVIDYGMGKISKVIDYGKEKIDKVVNYVNNHEAELLSLLCVLMTVLSVGVGSSILYFAAMLVYIIGNMIITEKEGC